MSRYKRPLRSDELYHRDTKFIAKIGDGKDARYFYSQAELRAYQLGQRVKNKTSSVKEYITGEYHKELVDMDDKSKRKYEYDPSNVGKEVYKLADKQYEDSKNRYENETLAGKLSKAKEYITGSKHREDMKRHKEQMDNTKQFKKYDDSYARSINGVPTKRYSDSKKDYENNTLPGKVSKTINDIKKGSEYKKKMKESEREYTIKEYLARENQKEIDKDRDKYDSRVRRRNAYDIKAFGGSEYQVKNRRSMQKKLKDMDLTDARRAHKNYEIYKNKYEATPIGKAEKQINKGKNRVKKLFGK